MNKSSIEMDNDFEGRSVFQEYDYGDRKKAMKQIQLSNRGISNRSINKLNHFQNNLSFQNYINSPTIQSPQSRLIKPSFQLQKIQKFQNNESNQTDQDEKFKIPEIIRYFKTNAKAPKKLENPKKLDNLNVKFLLESICNNEQTQNEINENRKNQNLEEINFHDLKIENFAQMEQNITMDQLIHILKILDIKKNQEVQPSNETSNNFYKYRNMQHLQQMSNKTYGFKENEGVNQLVYEDKFNYLDDLKAQKKRRFYPSIVQKSINLSQNIAPAIAEVKQSQTSRNNSSIINESNNDHPFTTIPAGRRIPKLFMKNEIDQIPDIIKKMQDEGASKEDIKKQVKQVQQKFIDEHQMNSKIGYVLSHQNNYLVKNKNQNKQKSMNSSFYNSQNDKLNNTFEENKKLLNKSVAGDQWKYQFKNKLLSERNSLIQREQWSTTNRESYKPIQMESTKAHRINFKQKTPFTQWANAYYGYGVFFNAPVDSI